LKMDETGTIAVREGSDLRLGGTVSFDVTFSPDNLDKKHKGGVRVEVIAYDPSGAIIFGTAQHYDQSFVLGGGWSPWREQGGPAHCVANLYYFSYHGSQQYNRLASVSFEAAGA
jgi:hypothetical protein